MITPTIERCKEADYRQSTKPYIKCHNCNHAQHIRYAREGYKFECDVLNIETIGCYVCKYYCNPCAQCRHLYDDSDESVGLYGTGCSADDIGLETNEGSGKFPCPSFSPFKASDNLIDQLAIEEMARLHIEEEEYE